MASTFSDLKIELMATGEQSGTWGTTTNTNLGTAIEQAITGSGDVPFSSADVTLTLTDTNASQTARNLRLNLTGTSGGARNLIVPAIEKQYIINNGLADAVTVKNSTGTGVAVPAGKTMVVFNNATDVVDVTTYASSLTLGAALPISSGGTGQTSASAAFNALSPITTTGDLIIGNGTNSATRLGIGSNGFVLTSNGTTAVWAASTGGVTSFSAGTTGLTPSTGTTGAITLAGTLAVANGGTGQTTYTDGQLLIGNSTGNTLTKSTLTAGSGISITNGSGTITIASTGSLPSQTGNAGKFLTTDGSTASWANVGGALATPTFSTSTNTPTGGSTVTVTITNYNAGYTYTIAVSQGTYTFNSGTGVISWTVPNVSSTTSASLTAFAQSGVQSSSVGTQTVSIQTSLVSDTPISITNFASYSLNNGWAI